MTTGAAKSGGESKRAELRERLAQLVAAGDDAAVLELMEQLVADNDALASHNDALASRNDELASRNDELDERVRRLDVTVKHFRRLLFGRRSEKLTAEDIRQLVLDYGGSAEDASASEPVVPVPEFDEAEPEESDPEPKKRRKHRGRTNGGFQESCRLKFRYVATCSSRSVLRSR